MALTEGWEKCMSWNIKGHGEDGKNGKRHSEWEASGRNQSLEKHEIQHILRSPVATRRGKDSVSTCVRGAGPEMGRRGWRGPGWWRPLQTELSLVSGGAWLWGLAWSFRRLRLTWWGRKTATLRVKKIRSQEGSTWRRDAEIRNRWGKVILATCWHLRTGGF